VLLLPLLPISPVDGVNGHDKNDEPPPLPPLPPLVNNSEVPQISILDNEPPNQVPVLSSSNSDDTLPLPASSFQLDDQSVLTTALHLEV
jgi:hypothetical protein